MKIKIIFFNLFLLILTLSPNKLFSNEVKILYEIENEIITNIDIENEIKYLTLINPNLSQLNEELLVEYSTKSILREKIKRIELKKNYKFGANEKVIEDKFLKFKNDLNISDENFDSLISTFDLSKEYFFKKIEIELLWNNLIYEKFKDQINIDREKITNEIKKNIENEVYKANEYLLYEILFSFETKEKSEILFSQIIKSIEEIGFENTATVLSISESSKFGGKVGWVNENQLSSSIIKKISNLNISQISDPIDVPSGKLILMIKDKREVNSEISIEDEAQKIINLSIEKQFEQFSQIYFKKIELNTNINEK